MRCRELLIVTVGLCVVAMPGGDVAAGQTVRNEKLRQELLRRKQEDQDVRKEVMELMRAQRLPFVPEKVKNADLPAIKKLNDVDRRNTLRLKEILEQHGWPGKTLV